MRREFSRTHTVRYDECNCYGYLTPPAFLRYMQDIAAQDAEDARLSGNGYWLVKRTVISFAAPIPAYTKLYLRTYGMGFTRITAQRGYEAHLTDDYQQEPVISSRTLWVYVDARGRPARMPEETAGIWLPDGPLEQEPEPPLPTFPETPPATTQALVRYSDIDLMRHLNNASAVEMLDDAAWEVSVKQGLAPENAQFAILRYEIEYLDSPLFNEELEISTWLEPFPVEGQEFSRFQQITREGKVMLRASSRWLWRPTATKTEY